jgi:hypothetical protein
MILILMIKLMNLTMLMKFIWLMNFKNIYPASEIKYIDEFEIVDEIDKDYKILKLTLAIKLMNLT